MSNKKAGGQRKGSGAKQKYGEKTVQISPFWCPESKVTEIKELIKAKLSKWVIKSKTKIESDFNSETFINNVCFGFRHDFGLMSESDKERLRFECKQWIRSINNNLDYF